MTLPNNNPTKLIGDGDHDCTEALPNTFFIRRKMAIDEFEKRFTNYRYTKLSVLAEIKAIAINSELNVTEKLRKEGELALYTVAQCPK